ncbi:MAG: GIY-YIG nuclease family protein [Atribacterota bacterium]|nr:GIY-YIG nuclease family protein [Atribacterota bacterium]
MDRKKELKQQYKQMKTKMGLYMIYSAANKKSFIETTKDLKGRINMTKFKLELGNHPVKSLQEDWKKFGKSNFTIEILEEVGYEEGKLENDYQDELSFMEMIWEEKLLKQNVELYKK